jgi:4-amino-4-deoxy-L-arabinose transferase-like glycosyltransferase
MAEMYAGIFALRVRKDTLMNPRSKKSGGWALVLVALGLLALYSGPRGLALLVPAAILVWYAVAESTPRDDRN